MKSSIDGSFTSTKGARLRKLLSHTFPKLFKLLRAFRWAWRGQRGGAAPYACLELFGGIEAISNEQLVAILAEAVDFTPASVRFVQIGSNDGKQGDPLYELVSPRDSRWTGVLVEPIPALFDRLRTNYRDRKGLAFVNALISSNRDLRTLYYVDGAAAATLPDLPVWFDQLGSFERTHIAAHLGQRIEPFIKSLQIEAMSLTDLFSEHGISDLELLHVDTEGHDYQIVKQLVNHGSWPGMVLVEFKHLSGLETVRLVRLLRRRYKLYRTDGDLFGMRTNLADRVRFSVRMDFQNNDPVLD